MRLGCTVAELLARLSNTEFMEWVEFYKIEPFGINAEMLGHAITAMTVANRWRGENEKAHEITEFLPDFEKQPQSTEEQLQIAQMFTYALGGRDLRKKDE